MNLWQRVPFREVLWWLALAAAPAVLSAWLHVRAPVWQWAPPVVPEVTVAAASRWTPPALWVDARPSRDFERAHVPHAVSLNETEWERLFPALLERWRPGQRIVVYCNAEQCHASQEVALRLSRELGVADIYVLQGGWTAWQRANP